MARPVGSEDYDDAAMRIRLAALSKDLSGGSAKPGPAPRPDDGPSAMGQAVSLGLRVTSEFVAAILVAGFIGWQLDRWFHSSPAGLIVFIVLGAAAGFWNVYRIAARTGSK